MGSLFPLSLNSPLEIHPDLMPYQISLHLLPPLLPLSILLIQFFQHWHPPIANYIYIDFPDIFHIPHVFFYYCSYCNNSENYLWHRMGYIVIFNHLA